MLDEGSEPSPDEVRGPPKEVLGGCKLCGKRMLTRRTILEPRTCEACKAKQRRTHNARLAARRKTQRHEGREVMTCAHCKKVVDASHDYARPERKYCSNRCRQAAFRERRKRGNT
jgi:hypothetical protein